MKGIDFFSELPIIWRLAFLAGAVSLAVAWYLYCRRAQRLSKDSEEPTPEVAKEFKMEDYDYVSGSDYHFFVSPVNTQLKVREIYSKNLDMMTYATSLPHHLDEQSAGVIKKSILEIKSIKFTSHEITVYKSPASDFLDFSKKLKGIIFLQLHSFYAQRFFRQRIYISLPDEKEEKDGLSLHFYYLNQFEDDFNLGMFPPQSVFNLIFKKDFTGRMNVVVVVKRVDSSWSDLKADIISAMTDYFPVGVDFEGQWPEDEPEKSKEIKVPFYFNKFGNLVLEFPGLELSTHIKLFLQASDTIAEAHIANVFDPKKSVVEIKLWEGYDMATLEQDVRSALALYDSQTDFVLDGEWPKAGIAIDSNTLGQGSINT